MNLSGESAQLSYSHTEIEATDQTCYFTEPQYTDTGPTTEPVTLRAWQGSHPGTRLDTASLA